MYYLVKISMQSVTEFDYFFSSFQKRATDTLKLILNTLRLKDDVILNAWELNERHYGNLTGLNKDEMKKKFGEKVIHKFRRSWDNPPEPLNRNNPYHPLNIKAYEKVPKEKIPDTESLKDTYERVIPFYKSNIEDKLLDGKNIIVSAHGNSIRAICKYLFNLDNKNITKLEIPTGNPLYIKFDKSLKIMNHKVYFVSGFLERNLISLVGLIRNLQKCIIVILCQQQMAILKNLIEQSANVIQNLGNY